MVLYLIIGIAIAEILYRVSGMKSKEMGILAVIACILCYIVKGIVTLLLAGVMITLSNVLSVLFNNSLIGYLFMFAGCYFAYMRSVD
jgi:ABC-type molybdate transport system permease subunit